MSPVRGGGWRVHVLYFYPPWGLRDAVSHFRDLHTLSTVRWHFPFKLISVEMSLCPLAGKQEGNSPRSGMKMRGRVKRDALASTTSVTGVGREAPTAWPPSSGGAPQPLGDALPACLTQPLPRGPYSCKGRSRSACAGERSGKVVVLPARCPRGTGTAVGAALPLLLRPGFDRRTCPAAGLQRGPRPLSCRAAVTSAVISCHFLRFPRVPAATS